MSSPKQRPDLIPYYGRLIATISKYTPELSKEMLLEVLPLLFENRRRLTLPILARKRVSLLAKEEESCQRTCCNANQGAYKRFKKYT